MKALTATLVFTAALIAPSIVHADESLRQELRQAIARGNAWLASQQKGAGYWDDEGLPAFTALALSAAVRDPEVRDLPKLPDHLVRGYDWLLLQQKEDGGIYNRGLSVYNTATSLTALTYTGKKEYEPAMLKARKHLIENQWDLGKKKETDNPNDGGVGYGSKNTHTDMSNTYLAIESLALSKHIIEDGEHGEQPDLDWNAALTFLSRCQNLTATNDQAWASDDADNKGGFVYTPGESKAGEQELPDGRVALRSYGSISYAGLLSFIYAKVSADDPRFTAVREWLGKNYTLDENPGMGAQGLYYYYQTMAKALGAANLNTLSLADGKQADWRKDLGNKLLTLQQSDGSWVNGNGRWMESNPILVTAYTVLALEQIYDSVPAR